jgi:hypothetical protein
MVHLLNEKWTIKAMHLACAMARGKGQKVVLVRMMAVNNPGSLGTELGVSQPTWAEDRLMRQCREVAEDYGVAFDVLSMQYLTLPEALHQAAALLDANTVFACLPPSAFPFWRRFWTFALRQTLAAENRMFYTLETREPAMTHLPPMIVSGKA